ncbi:MULTISPECIES: PAS domain-containing hybrid sensor histidine kinase/response regulator [unclassified Roseitalea]|uniref:PAS domain-containing hybrid sensor histidine kinase/response regulator n=1 Tax=unclassified Roseitalea TaxID=2639107 RepID=UPI00273D5BE3|nr:MULTISPECIES: PAS domain-containing hybrid sensor histidine kinase/response regulator [unclassified Roseitalea]
MQGWLVALAAFAYLATLFAVAAYGDRRARVLPANRPRPQIYALSLAVYCTSWTFFGSVGLATTSGFEFFAIYLGPILVFTLGYRLVRRVVHLSKSERITSIADFLGARYGKSVPVAALAACIAVVGTVPYIALQLKAVSDAVTLMVGQYDPAGPQPSTLPVDVSLIVAISLLAFSALFGTRHADATEHQDGLITAIAVESLVKLLVFLTGGIIIVFVLFGGAGPIAAAFDADPRVAEAIARGSSGGTWLVMTFLSACAIMMLPRQFHVTVVEHRSDVELKRAAFVFPAYLIVINLLVMPIAVAGLVYLGDTVPADMYLLALPLAAGQEWLALIIFIGGLSAATAMVIVASVALAIMVSNDLVIPAVLWRSGSAARTASGDWSQIILNIRRVAMAVIIFAAFAYYRQTGHTTQLASIGLLSFAAIAQFAPAFLIGLVWRGANARGAFAGMLAGFVVWTYTLLLPAMAGPEAAIVREGIFGIAFLRPNALFGVQFDPLVHGVFWSLAVNIALLVIGSLSRMPTPLERIQSVTFIPREAQQTIGLKRFRTTTTIDELKAALARYVGVARMERAFEAFELREGRKLVGTDTTDIAVVRYAEQVLASAIGSSSARLVLSLLFEKDGASSRETVQLLDDASEALQQNRDLLQKALDQMDQGISVFNSEYRLTNWNGQFRRLLGLPPEMGNFGMPLKSITGTLVEAGQIDVATERAVVENVTRFRRAWQLPLARSGRIVEIRSNPMPDGGLVVTYTDITGRVEADEALKRTKESLEMRVRARTAELTKVNEELAYAQTRAEEANIGKTRFLAAAGHDISQPLNAARLYTSSLVERMARQGDETNREIAGKIDSALDSVEQIIGAVLDISRLDAGVLKPSPRRFALGELLEQVRNDFAPIAEQKGLSLKVVPTGAIVETDRNLLRRLLQNLVSNAIKYTHEGRVLVGVRRGRQDAIICIYDTGIGISADQAKHVFKEFQRLSDGARIASGLGLGLSIVDRISRVLSVEVSLTSTPGRGTGFKVSVPTVEAGVLPATARPAMHGQARTLLTGMRIACIDNDEPILAGMRTLLTGWGAQVIGATQREELESALSANGVAPHVIIADYHLDDGDGMQVIARMRARYGEAVTAVLVTADRSAELRAQAERQDVQLLNKPLKPAALRALLAQVPMPREAAE